MKHVVVALVLLFAGCAKQHHKNLSEYKPQNIQEILRNLHNEVKIVDFDLVAIPQADVVIGESKFVTDNEGVLKIPGNWTNEATLTIKKEGFIPTTYMNQVPQNAVYIVKSKPGTVKYEVKGNTQGYPDLKKDGWIDFSLAVKPFTRADIVNFDISKVVSGEVDTMEVIGQTLEIPANISLPPQKESYMFFNLNLDKSLYRVGFDTLGPKELLAHRGRFEAKPVIDKMRKGAAFYEVMNDLKFQSLEVTKFDLIGNMMLDLNTTAHTLAPKLPHKAPAFDPTLLYFTASLVKSRDTYVPSDYKFYKPGETQTMLLPESAASSYYISMLGEKKIGADGKVKGLTPKMSITLSASNENPNIPLDVIPIPTISAGVAKCLPPTKKIEVAPLGTYAALSKVTTRIFETSSVDEKEILWEVYAPSWVSEIQLPQISADLRTTEVSRFEVTYLGSTGQPQAPLGPLQFDETTHASRNAVDY